MPIITPTTTSTTTPKTQTNTLPQIQAYNPS